MRLTRAYQFHPVIAYGDAIGNDTFALERLLWARGARSRIYAAHAHDEVAAFVRPWRDLAIEPRDGALLMLRHSMGNDCVDEVGDLPLPKVLRYHNITPARYFVGLNEELRKYSELGREQLRRHPAGPARAGLVGVEGRVGRHQRRDQPAVRCEHARHPRPP